MAPENEIGDLRSELIEKTLERTLSFPGMEGLTGEQLKPAILIAAKCTLMLTETLGSTGKEIRAFNDSTEALTNQMLRLNWWLTFASIVGAIATCLGVVATAILAYKAIV